jgi:phosphatidylinositol alpha-1,6-mannosyltransferase
MKEDVKKIGFVTSSVVMDDGWGRYSRSLVKGVAESVQVAVLTSGEYDKTCFFSVWPVLPAPSFSPLVQVKTFFYILKYLRDCDVIHSLVEPYMPAVALASIILRVPCILTMHGTYAVPPKNFSMKKLMMKFAYRTALITTTGSPQTEQKVREVVKLNECRFIPNGVDSDIFKVLPEETKRNFILTVGALKPRKGVDIVIKALEIIKGEFPFLNYKVIGYSDSSDFSSYLKRLVKEKGVEERVEFLNGISDDKLVKLYNQAKIFILAARTEKGSFEGFPMVFYEANACGTPVISTTGFGSEYAIKNGINGYLVQPDKPEEVAGAIRKIINGDYEMMAANSLKEAKQHSWKAVSKQLVKMYNDAYNYFYNKA